MSRRDNRNILDILEQFFTKRKSPGDLVEAGVLKEDPTQPQPGGGTGCYFNRFLSDVPKQDNIPCIVVECCRFLEENDGLKEEGLFRVPGSTEEIKAISAAFEKDGHCPTLSSCEISSVAGVLKLYFRCMPQPLFTFEHYPSFMSVAREHGSDELALLQGLTGILMAMPKDNCDLILYLLRFLKRCSEYYEQSKMNVDNLAMVFAPNVLRPETETLQQIMEDSNNIKVVLRTLINNAEKVSLAI